MSSQAHPPLSNFPMSATVDPAFWNHQHHQDLTNSSPLSLHLSPTTSATPQESVHSLTPPAQTPKSDTGKNASSGQSTQNGQNPTQSRTSVAVACVPCRSRHLKCDGGIRCSRCRADDVECTYIKSRRGWKGKRKKNGENGASSLPSPPGKAAPSLFQKSSNSCP